MKIRKNDTVIVLSGKDKGKTGKVEKVLPKRSAVLVSGVNICKRHVKKRDEKNPGGIIDIARPIHISKVALVDPKEKKPTRVGFLLSKGEKLRISKRTGDVI